MKVLGSGNHVGGTGGRPLPTGAVTYGEKPQRRSFDWGDGATTPTRAPRDKPRAFDEPDPDDYTEPPVGECQPDAGPSIEAEFEEESTPDNALASTLPKSDTSTEDDPEPDQILDSRKQSDDGHSTKQASKQPGCSADATQMRSRAADEQAQEQAGCSEADNSSYRCAPRGGGKLGPHTTEIVRRYTDGESSSQIAEEYGCSPAAVTALLHREGVHVRTRREGIRLRNGTPEAPEAEEPGHKTCSKCATSKPTSEFGEHKLTTDGLASECRDCNNRRPPTEARLIRTRARNRATSALVQAHKDEFDRLLETKTQEAVAKLDRIRAAAADNHDAGTARLRPGPRRRSQSDVVERIDVARCRTCHTHHDVNHVCPTCGDDTPEQAPEVPAYVMRAWARAEGMAPVPPNGPLPARIVTAYEQAHAPAEQEAAGS